MRLRIFQINPDRDRCKVKFMRYSDLAALQGSQNVNPEIYDLVWEEEDAEKTSLDGIYARFNLAIPKGFFGHSLSVSDVIEIRGTENDGYFYCDYADFKEIDFDA